MISIAIIIIIGLWIYSLFSFAKWGIRLDGKKATIFYPTDDWIFQAYLKISGIAVLVWIVLMVR